MIVCNQCGNPLEADARWCSECGAQAATNKPINPENVNSNLRSPPSATSPTSSLDAATTNRSRMPMYVIIALLALIAGGGIVALLRPNKVETVGTISNPSPLPSDSPGEDKKTSSEPIVPNQSPLSATQTPQPSTGQWFVVLGSFPKNDRAKANQRLQSVQGSGYSARIIDTDNYPGLRGGLWAVVLGPYSKTYAKSVADQMKVMRPDAYIKSGW